MKMLLNLNPRLLPAVGDIYNDLNIQLHKNSNPSRINYRIQNQHHQVNMCTTLSQIANFLDNRQWKYDLQPEKDRIITGVRADNVESFVIIISVKEDGEYLEIAAPALFQVREHQYKSALLQTLLSLTYSSKMIRWEYDPMDGEVRASVAFPLEDAILTEKQFNRCLSGLIYLVDEVAVPRILGVLKTGIDPQEQEIGERLLLTLQEHFPGSLTMLEEALAARKQRGAASALHNI